MSTDSVPAQTSVPNWMMTYCRQLSDVYYDRKLNRMYLTMLEAFLETEPWKATPPFDWHEARIHASKSPTTKRANSDPDWVPMNMHLPTDLYNRITETIELIELNAYSAKLKRSLSLRTFLYTAVCWWVQCVYPYSGPGVISN